MDWSQLESPSLDDFEALARAAFAFMIQDFPDEDVVDDMALESEFDILGLFQGPDLAAHEAGHVHGGQTMIFLYRRPILDYWAEHREALGDIVRHVLIHEIGHHFGLSDEDMEAIEG